MAKKEPPKPLFSLKGDFYASLDNAAQCGVNLLQVVDSAIDLNQVSEQIKPMLKQRADAYRAALMSDD